MLKHVVLAALQISGVLLTVLVSFGYMYLRMNGLAVTIALCALVLGGVYWATLDLERELAPWGDRLLGAVFAACGFVLWGQLRQTRFLVRRERRTTMS